MGCISDVYSLFASPILRQFLQQSKRYSDSKPVAWHFILTAQHLLLDLGQPKLEFPLDY